MRRSTRILLGLPIAGALALLLATAMAYRSPVATYHRMGQEVAALEFRDRSGEPLSATYQNAWNLQRQLPLHTIPPLLKTAFILSEDKRFYEHAGIDWRARASALYGWVTTGSLNRGASSITEQVVRILHPRPRTIWSKWMETWEAMALEHSLDKDTILELYLNQVPYAANRRGVAQAADYYFRRDVMTLSPREMLTLVVLVRAPSRFDPYRDASFVEKGTARLAKSLHDMKALNEKDYAALQQEELLFAPFSIPVDARHFLRFVKRQEDGHPHSSATLITTLDGSLQERFSEMLRDRVAFLSPRGVNHAALLVADHLTGEILAWVTEGKGCAESQNKNHGCALDMVTTPRQPGSALKPFLYASALTKGWSAATMIEDAPYSEAVGRGLHAFRNYSNQFYGPVTLRQALANSLNIPALKTIRYVGVEPYFRTLHRLGFTSLTRDAAIYDEGLALGNGEVSLLELVNAYATLARGGVRDPLRWKEAREKAATTRIYSEEVATLIGNILSDPYARQWEFGVDSVLNFPVQTAVKTGTSTGYRDAWAVGYNYRYVAGVWMGNLDHEPMEEVTGSTGPALLLRAVFQQLTAGEETKPLPLSPHLEARDICVPMREGGCVPRTEYMIPGTPQPVTAVAEKEQERPSILRPTPGLELAVDPRIPAHLQRFEFVVGGWREGDRVAWFLDDAPLGERASHRLDWTLAKGKHRLTAQLAREEMAPISLPPVTFTVK